MGSLRQSCTTILTIALATLIFAAPFFAPTVFAQETTPPAEIQIPQLNTAPTALTPPPTTLPSFTETNRAQLEAAAGVPLIQTPAAGTAATPAAEAAPAAAQSSKEGAPVEDTSNFLAPVVWKVVVAVFGMLLGAAGVMLDVAINNFVIDFSGQYTATGIGAAIESSWVIIRDFINLLFIFGFVYIGFKMILDSDSSSTRKLLVRIIVAALLINFSLFITKFVIDISNQLSYEIVLGAFGTGSDGEVDMAGTLMKEMGITTMFSSGSLKGGWGYIFGTAIMFTVTAFVFAAGAFLLMIRFVVLCLFMVLSPLMFIGWVLPPVSDLMSKYWKMFLSRAFFAPVYFTLIYVSIGIIGGLSSKLDEQASFSTAFTEGGARAVDSAGSTLPFFFMICIFMIASLVIAQKMGADGASKAVSMGKSWGKKSSKFVAAQTAGRVARNVTNKAGDGVKRSLHNLQQVQGNNKVTRVLAAGVRKAARTNAVEGVVGGAAKKMQGAKYGMSRNLDEEDEMKKKTNKRADTNMALDAGLKAQALKEAKKGLNSKGQVVDESALTPAELKAWEDAREAKITAMESAAAKLTVKDFEEMSDDQQKEIATFLSGNTYDAAMKSDKISDTQKDAIKGVMRKKITDTISENGELLTDKLTDLSIRQIEILGEEFVMDNADAFSDSQFSDIKKSKAFTESQTGRFIGKRKQNLKDKITGTPAVPATATSPAIPAVAANPASAFRLSTKLNPRGVVNFTDPRYSKAKKAGEIARLPGDVLAMTIPGAIPGTEELRPEIVDYLTADVLKAIAETDKDFNRVSEIQRAIIKAGIMKKIGPPHVASPAEQRTLNFFITTKGVEAFG